MHPRSTKRRVTVTGLRGVPNVMGGVESHCEELLPRIAELAPDLDMTVTARRPYIREPLVYRGLSVTPVASVRDPRFEAITSTFLSVLQARVQKTELLHIHSIGPALMAPLARLLGMRVIVTHHGADYDRGKWGRFAKLALRLGEKAAVVASHRVIVVSPSLNRDLKRRWPKYAYKFRYIPNGATELPVLHEDRRTVLARLGLEDRRYVLSVGRLVPEKGFDYLIRSFLSSEAEGILAIAGAADHETGYSDDLLKRANSRIRFLGMQPRSTLRHLYEGTRLFVLPSYHEGLPIAALEAARCGTPMLLSDITGNSDLGLPARCYFPVGDETALTKALSADPDVFRYNAEQIVSKFDWRDIAARTLAEYRELLRCER